MSAVEDVCGLVPAAMDRFGAAVYAVPADRWAAPTPCAEWSVRDLVAHLCFEHLWAPHVLAGESMESVGKRYAGDLLGDDPARAWTQAAATSRAAWLDTGAHAAAVHTSFGPIPVEEYAVQMLLDLTVHEWDLARGAGLDERVDAACVDRALVYVRSDPIMLTGPGLFGPRTAPRGDTPLDELLAALGR